MGFFKLVKSECCLYKFNFSVSDPFLLDGISLVDFWDVNDNAFEMPLSLVVYTLLARRAVERPRDENMIQNTLLWLKTQTNFDDYEPKL